MKKLFLIFVLGILLLGFVSSELTTSSMDIKIDSKITTPTDVKVHTIETDNVRILRVMEGKKIIGRDIIFKSKLSKGDDIEKITKEKITTIVNKDIREEIVITKPNILTKLIKIIFKK
jgi:hypothetical protein